MVCLMICGGLLFSLVSCGGGDRKATKNANGELSGNITISGAFALYPLAVKWSEEFQKLHSGVRIDLSAGGAGKGMTDVLADVVDLGMVSREVYSPELEKGALPFASAKDAVVITINAENPLAQELIQHGISKEAATKIWITGEYTTWGQVLGTDNNTPIHVYTRSDACGAAETFAMWMGMKQEDLLGTAVFGDPGLASAIQADKLGIGLNNIGYAYDEKSRKPNTGLLVCPIDANSDGTIDAEEYFYDTKDDFIAAVAEDKYPSPPARDLYLVSHGVPTNPVVVAFLEYVLTEGQQYNVPIGYISLSEDKLQKGLEQLKTNDQ
ncbi:MAG: PstS family phosphate ABC transporter substrate-binding protein [Bacteroidales bacterium]|nr:PstS family phosphate ABC transporter substrate-binding protein [Bacteroidales bacterium]